MYCIHCGAEAAIVFCAVCGQRQSAHATDAHETPTLADEIVYAVLYWTESIQYNMVLGHSDVRGRIAAAGRKAGHSITGDDLLAIFDAVSPIGFSLGSLSKAVLPIYEKMGIRTAREATKVFQARPGRVMLASLCALATKSLVIADVHQDTDKCSLTADVPSGLITNRGKLHILLAECDSGVEVTLAVTIAGQFFDWGKSARLIDETFAFIQADLVTQRSEQISHGRRIA